MNVDHIIVLGHSQCGGIGALVTGYEGEVKPSFIKGWMACMSPAVDAMNAAGGAAWELGKQRAVCEREALKVSLGHLITYPWLARQVEAGALTLHAWHYDLATGALEGLNPETQAFETLVKPGRPEST